MMEETERHAIERDAATQLVQLRADRRRLWPDRADPTVALELHGVLSRLRMCERALGLNAKTRRFAVGGVR